MTNSVYFDPAYGGDGSTVTDDADPTTGLAQGGHRTRFVPALEQTVAIAGGAVTAAASLIGGAGTNGTSTSSLVIWTGNQTFTTQTGKSYVVGMQVMIAYTNVPTTWMSGREPSRLPSRVPPD